MTVGNATLNLTRRKADVALRVGNQPPETLVGRRVGRLAFAVYGSAGTGDASALLAERAGIGFNAEHAPLVRAFAEFLPGVMSAFRVNCPAVDEQFHLVVGQVLEGVSDLEAGEAAQLAL